MSPRAHNPGEKVALYFVWLGQYTSWLISASIMGGLTYFIDSILPATMKPPLAPLFAFFMAVWNTLFLENWKRKQVRSAPSYMFLYLS